MSINKSITNTKRPVLWKGEVAAKVRAISPHDLAVVLVRAGEDVDSLFTAWDAIKTPEIDMSTGQKIDPQKAAELLMQKAPDLILKFATHLPKLLADIIAVAADSPDDSEYIQSNFPAPLQFDCLVAIAEETFVDPAGFREFVGKVTALVQVAKGIVSPNAVKKSARAKTSKRG